MFRKRESINANFAKSPLFLKACELAGIEPTKRQASRFRNRTGQAFRFIRMAREALKRGDNSTVNKLADIARSRASRQAGPIIVLQR